MGKEALQKEEKVCSKAWRSNSQRVRKEGERQAGREGGENRGREGKGAESAAMAIHQLRPGLPRNSFCPGELWYHPNSDQKKERKSTEEENEKNKKVNKRTRKDQEAQKMQTGGDNKE